MEAVGDEWSNIQRGDLEKEEERGSHMNSSSNDFDHCVECVFHNSDDSLGNYVICFNGGDSFRPSS